MNLREIINKNTTRIKQIDCILEKNKEKVTSIDSLQYLNNFLILNFTTTSGADFVEVELPSMSIRYNVLNYSELITKTPNLYDLAYVRESQGTPWLPGSVGGDYYANGLYMWDGVNWIEDDTNIHFVLDALINEHQVLYINSDMTLPDSANFKGTLTIKNISTTTLNIETTVLDKLEDEDTQEIGPGDSFTIKLYQINNYKII